MLPALPDFCAHTFPLATQPLSTDMYGCCILCCCVFQDDCEPLLFPMALLAVLTWSEAESVSFRLGLGGEEGHNRTYYNLFTLQCESKALGISPHMEMWGSCSKPEGW